MKRFQGRQNLGGNRLIVALHSAPQGFFKTDPPHGNDELVELVRKAASLGFKAVEIGPLRDYVTIDSEQLRTVLQELKIERTVHVGEIYDAEKFALTEHEYATAKKRALDGIKLCREISSTLASIHPPFFTTGNKVNNELLSKARTRFLKLMKEETDSASRNHVRIALESFCYHPFIFQGLHDFAKFVSKIPSEKLGVLLDIGHLYQIGIDLSEAIQVFKHRLAGIHVHDAKLENDFRKATHLPIGRGTIDFRSLIKLLRAVNYRGWLTLEIRGTEKEIVKSKEYLENLITETS
jgi:sugar phosphate isomerase/epimerase